MTADNLLVMPVTEPWQVEIMRQIFNRCLDGYTRPLTPQTDQQQQDWWAKQPEDTAAFLYLPAAQPWKFVGFSLLRRAGRGFKSPIMGVLPEERGNGYGKAIVRHYILEAAEPLAGEALVTNTPINEINKQLGWKVVGQADGVLKLYHPGCNRQQEIYDEILHYHGLGG